MLIFCSYNRPAVCLSATSYARVLAPTNILRLSSNDETKDIICIAEKSYFVEILNNLGCEQIVLELADPSRAGLILPTENEEDEDLLSLLMPMMLSD